MPESSSSSSSAAVKRACDACHRRKVKCIGDGTRPCKNCSSSGLSCTYNAVPQKKGPKGSRAKVISELRETQRQSQLTTNRYGFDSPPGSPTYTRRPDLLSMEIITTCVDFFFANLYPTQPILHRQKLAETVGQMDTDPEAYCLVFSLCGYMLIQPNMELQIGPLEDLDWKPQSNLHLGRALLQEAIRVRKSFNFTGNPSIWSVITSFFFFGSYFCLDAQSTAWFHLREATTLALILGMNEESSYRTADIIENSRRRRLYWLLFVTERAYALQQHRPLTLYATINLPTLDDDPAESMEINGFLHLVNLFRPFDDTFVGVWNKTSSNTVNTDWLARMQQQLSDALPVYLQSTESQAVDLRCSQQWLRTMIWQLSISHGFLSSAAADNAMSFKFPIEISRDLIAATSQFSQQAMEVHGIGLIEKLFDVACTLTDVISCVPYERNTFEYGPRDYLNQLVSLISNLRGGQERYMPLLISKFNDTMPNAPSFALSSIAANSRVSEIYGESQEASSTSNSNTSTPFGSPTLSDIGQQSQGFFQQEMALGGSSTPSGFPTPIMATSADYGVNVSAPMYFPDSANYQGASPTLKFEPDG